MEAYLISLAVGLLVGAIEAKTKTAT